MDNIASQKRQNSKTSLKNNILLSFFLVLTIAGITINAVFQNVIQKTLLQEGLEPVLVAHIIRHFTIVGSGTTIAGIIISLCVAFFVSETIARPIKKLTAGMLEIAHGKWGTRINIKNHDELGQLAYGFNLMAEHVEESLKNLNTANNYTADIIASVPSILIVLSDRLNILSVNPAFNKLKEQFPDLTSDQFMPNLLEEVQRNRETGETLKKEFIITPGTDVSLIFSAVISRIGNVDFKCKGEEKAFILLTITDITERKKMKEMVLQSKQDWEDTFNTLPDMITIHDNEFNIIQANKAAHEILKLPFLSPGRMNKCYRFYHGTEKAPKGCPSCDCMVTAKAATFEVFEPYLEKYIEIRSIPRLNNKNELIGLIHIVRDITQRKMIEDEHNQLLKVITKAKIEWEATFDTVNEFIILIDKEFKIKRCNSSFSQYTGLPTGRLINKKYFDCFAPSDPVSLMDFEKKIRSEELIERIEIKTSDDKWFYVSHRPIHDKKGKYMHTVVIATNITDLKIAQQKLKHSEHDLKKQVEDLENFYDMAVGRELKMKELKKEVRKLNTELSTLKENEFAKN